VKEDENNKPHESSQEQTTTTTTTSSSKNGVYFANLKEGDQVKSPVVVEMGINGMEVEAAGAMNEGKGHHHIIVDGSFEPKGTMVPKDETHLHYGQGQTSDTLALTPGKHTLTLQFANGMHQSYGEEWSKTITIMVSE
jgi:hypothetical protein